jgi:hypothetical protein
MEIIAITGILGVLAVIVLAVVRPWETGRLAAIYLFWAYRPAHGGGLTGPEVADVGQSAMSRWEYGIMGVDICPRCGGPLASAPCSSCGWERPPDRAPWPRLTDEDRAALAAGFARARAIADEPRPGAVVLPARTADISGSGAPVTPPEPPAWAAYPLPWPEPPEPAPADLGGPWGAIDPLPPWATDGGVWRIPAGAYASPEDAARAAVPEPPPPEPELPPSGDWAPGTGPPEDDEPESLRCLTCHSPQPSMHPATAEGGEVCHLCPDPFHGRPEAGTAAIFAPSRLATPFDCALAAEVADALSDQNADAAVYIDRLARGRREYVWQIRRGFLVAQGLAYP